MLTLMIMRLARRKASYVWKPALETNAVSLPAALIPFSGN